MTKLGLSNFAQLTDAFYQAAFDADLWASVMLRLSREFDGSLGALVTLNTSRQPTMFHGDCAPEFAQTFLDPRLDNPFIPLLLHGRPSEIVVDQAVLPRRELRRTRFFNEWLAPQDSHSFLACRSPLQTGQSALICLHRGGGRAEYSSAEVEALALLTPAFARAAALCLRLGSLRRDADARRWDALGAGYLIVDAKARLLSLNATAEVFLSAPDAGIGISGGRVVAITWPRANALGALIAAACRAGDAAGPPSGDLVARSMHSGMPRLVLSVAPFLGEMAADLPVSRAAVIIIQNLSPKVGDRFERRLRSLFGFTPREAGLAATLSSGRSLQAHATEHNISIETARTHLRGLFAKSATTRQGELVALLNRIARLVE